MVSYGKTTIFPMLSPFNSHRRSPRLPAPIHRRPHPSRPSERAPRQDGDPPFGVHHETARASKICVCMYVCMNGNVTYCNVM